MTGPKIQDEDKPLDPSVEKVRRKLLRFMVINLGILFLAFAVVIGAFIYKSTSLARKKPAGQAQVQPPSGADAISGTITLPAGARIVSQSLSGNQVLLNLERADGSREFLLYDLQAGRTLGQYTVKAP